MDEDTPTAGPDTLIRGDGPHTIHGLGGDDFLVGGRGFDRIYGDNGNDYLYGGDPADDLAGIPSRTGDFLVGGHGDDKLFVASGNCVLGGGTGNDTIIGGSGDDDIGGDLGFDVVSGGAGDDIFTVIDDDEIDGGAGRDEITFYLLQVGTGVKLNLASRLAQETGAAGRLKVALIEDIYGSPGADSFTGTAQGNKLDGASGHDRLAGAGGNDTLWGGIGNDTIIGGAGKDTLKGFFGRDVFVFATAPAKSNLDDLEDFTTDEDRIALESRAFGGFTADGRIDKDAFVIGTAARDEEDRIVYDQARGHLYHDPDGKGGAAAVKFAFMQPGLTIAYTDFIVL